MKLLYRLYRWSRKLRSHLPGEPEPALLLAFTHNKKEYYQFENPFEITTGRGLFAMTVYEEFRMRCDREYLIDHCKAVDTLLKKKEIGVQDILMLLQIHQNLKERLDLAPFPDHIYKLASVMFFEKNESPYNYDFAFNQKKIAEWRADPDMLPFLVKVPLGKLMPYTKSHEKSLPIYFRYMEEVAKISREKAQQVISSVH
jgi:hypothetical protein